MKNCLFPNYWICLKYCLNFKVVLQVAIDSYKLAILAILNVFLNPDCLSHRHICEQYGGVEETA